ncbi:MAG: hypothetical protein AAF352_08350, partial [Pseudomonadota bacterium]
MTILYGVDPCAVVSLSPTIVAPTLLHPSTFSIFGRLDKIIDKTDALMVVGIICPHTIAIAYLNIRVTYIRVTF